MKWDYPIVDLGAGAVGTCCQTPRRRVSAKDIQTLGTDIILNTPYEQDRRRDSLNGIAHPDCESCFSQERQGLKSLRKGLKEWEGPLPDVNDANVYRSYTPKKLGLILGNACDLKCLYCSPESSTSWIQEKLSYGETGVKKFQAAAEPGFREVFWQWFNSGARHKIEYIKIYGGEPTYSPLFYEVLDQLIAAYEEFPQNQKRVTLGIVTNLNSSSKIIDRFVDRIPSLTKHFDICLQPSMESFGARAEYIRHGVRWSVFEDNWNRLAELKSQIGEKLSFECTLTLNALNITSLKDFILWVQELEKRHQVQVELLPNAVAFPSSLNPLVLTPDFARHVEETLAILSLDKRRYRAYLEQLKQALANPYRSEYQLKSRKEFYGFIRLHDERRRTDFLQVFPEYQQFWDLENSLTGTFTD